MEQEAADVTVVYLLTSLPLPPPPIPTSPHFRQHVFFATHVRSLI